MWGRTQATKMHPDDLTGPGLQESGTPPFTSERALGITRSLHGRQTGDTQRDREGITIAVTPVKIEMISSGIAQAISTQLGVIGSQREGGRENEHTNTRAHQEQERKPEMEPAGSQHGAEPCPRLQESPPHGRLTGPCGLRVRHLMHLGLGCLTQACPGPILGRVYIIYMKTNMSIRRQSPLRAIPPEEFTFF